MWLRAVPVLLFALALLALAPACGGDSAGDDPTPTAIEDPNQPTLPPLTATFESKISIRDHDFESELEGFLASAGDVELQIGYVDVTQDGDEDAIILVSSMGSGGDIAGFVYRWTGDGVEEVLRVTPDSGVVVLNVIAGGVLESVDPVYAEGDPLCCPSAERITTYTWEGEEFVVTEERTEEVPQQQ